MLCPENYPLSCGLLLPPPPAAAPQPLVVVQAELDPSSCRLYVAYVAFAKDGQPHPAHLPTHIAA
jgi:hypothetical protein